MTAIDNAIKALEEAREALADYCGKAKDGDMGVFERLYEYYPDGKPLPIGHASRGVLKADEALAELTAYKEQINSEELVEKVAEELVRHSDDYDKATLDQLEEPIQEHYKGTARAAISVMRDKTC